MPVRTMNSEEARNEWRMILDLVSQAGIDVVIEHHGKATVAVLSYEVYRAIEPALAALRAKADSKESGRKMASILEQLAALPSRITIADPVQWQIDQRQDRPLPGRGV